MSFQTFATQRLAALTAMVNAIGTNAKKIDELPIQSTLDPVSKIHVSRGGTSESLELQKIIDVINAKNYSQLLSVGEISVTGLVVSVPSGAQWVYEGVNYQTTAITNITETLCAAGFLRKDILVANQSNQIVLIKGAESLTIRIRPNIPVGTVLVTELDIDDTVIGVPTIPIIGANYIEKIEKSFIEITDDGIVDYSIIYAENKKNGLNINGTVTSFGGFNIYPPRFDDYSGRKLTIKNSQSTPVTLQHNNTAGDYFFYFPNETDFVIKPNEIIEFVFDNTSGQFIYKYVGMIPIKIYPVGELQIFKVPGNPNNQILEVGDYCMGFVEGQFINANYTGGDRNLLTSFGI